MLTLRCSKVHLVLVAVVQLPVPTEISPNPIQELGLIQAVGHRQLRVGVQVQSPTVAVNLVYVLDPIQITANIQSIAPQIIGACMPVVCQGH